MLRREDDRWPESDPPYPGRRAAPIGHQLDRGQGADMGQRGIGACQDRAQPAASVRTDPVASLEADREAGMIEFEQFEMVRRTRQHLLEQRPKAVAADILAEAADHHAAPRPFGAVGGLARQVLRDIVDRGVDGITRAAAGLFVIARTRQRIVEARRRRRRALVEQRQVDLDAAGADRRDQRQQRRRRLHHRVARTSAGRGLGQVFVGDEERARLDRRCRPVRPTEAGWSVPLPPCQACPRGGWAGAGWKIVAPPAGRSPSESPLIGAPSSRTTIRAAARANRRRRASRAPARWRSRASRAPTGRARNRRSPGKARICGGGVGVWRKGTPVSAESTICRIFCTGPILATDGKRARMSSSATCALTAR